MSREQVVPALICALLREGVDPKTIERAVAGARGVALGQSFDGGDPLARAFAWEQAGLLRPR